MTTFLTKESRELLRLMHRALDGATWRGHTMRPFAADSNTTGHSTCYACGMGAFVDTHPMPNGIDIHGEAVALNCTSKGRR